MFNWRLWTGLPGLMIFFLLLAGEPAHAQDALTLGVHPYLASTELVRRFRPLADYLSRKIDVPVVIEISIDYQDHIDKIGKDRLDMAYMGPAPYVKLVKTYGPKPLLARLEINGEPTFTGVIIKARDNPIKSLAELRGKSFAFGDPDSTMSHLVPRYMIRQAGLEARDLSRYSFLHNHNNVALGVLVGDFDAGAVKEEVFFKYRTRGLSELARTPRISEHLFVASDKLPDDQVKAIRSALLRLKDDPEGRAIMVSIKETVTGFVPVRNSDYDNLRHILESLADLGDSQ